SLIMRVAADRVAIAGAVLCGTGLVLIGSWDPGASLRVFAILAALVLQGFGVGLFQVAYMDMIMRTLPRQHRGVAGSIAMLSRSLGVVSGATLLTLLFHAVEGSALADGQTAARGFLSGFNATFRLAGMISGLAGALIALPVKARR